MISEFLQYLQYEKNYSSHTVLSYRAGIESFIEFQQLNPDNFTPNTISATHIQQWVLFLMQDNNNSPRTIAQKISTLKSFWRFLLQRGYAKKNPLLKIVLPKTKKPIPTFFKHKEMEAVLDDTFLPNDFERVRDRLVLELFYATGMRLSELLNIEDSDVYLNEGSLKVLGKRNKERIIPLSKELCRDIERYIELRNESVELIDKNLFVRKNGKKPYPKLIYNIVHAKMSEVSSQQKRSPHVLRHTFATAMLNNGADINAVKELLGHGSLAATQVYTHTSFEELHNIYKHAHPRAK
jgi:integrase/recombinase XerC